MARASNVGKENGNEAAANQLSGEVILGELIWVKPNGLSWWPAQIVDENRNSGSSKPSNKLTGDVLVRLYGSYKYIYVNPMKCRAEFENFLEQHEGNHTEILTKALEQELSYFRSGRLKRKGTRTKGESKVNATKDNASKGNAKKKTKTGTPTSAKSTSSKQSVEKNSNFPSEEIVEAKSSKRKQDEVKKKLEQNPLSARNSPRQQLPKSPVGADSKGKIEESKELKQKTPSHATTPVKTIKEVSARRTKVMQTLGLAAPSGSPFHQNGKVSAKLQPH